MVGVQRIRQYQLDAVPDSPANFFEEDGRG